METYFVDSFYHLSGCPKMEDTLMSKAREHLMYRIVSECDLGVLVREVQHWQDLLLKENPRWRPCEVKIWKNPIVAGNIVLYIGGSSLMAQRVEGYYQAE